jgi:hypothetical protein
MVSSGSNRAETDKWRVPIIAQICCRTIWPSRQLTLGQRVIRVQNCRLKVVHGGIPILTQVSAGRPEAGDVLSRAVSYSGD